MRAYEIIPGTTVEAIRLAERPAPVAFASVIEELPLWWLFTLIVLAAWFWRSRSSLQVWPTATE